MDETKTMLHIRLPNPDHSLFTLGHLTIDDIVLLEEARLYLESSGGDALFSAIGAWVWGGRVGLIARAGQGYPQANIARIEAAGIACHLRSVPHSAVRNWALYEPDGARQFLRQTRSGSYAQLSIEGGEIPAECLSAAGYHIAPMPVAAQASVLQRLSGHQNLHALYAQPDHHEEKIAARPLITLDTFPEHLQDAESVGAVLALVGRVNCFLPSRAEAAILYGRDDPQAAARAFGELGPIAVCIKMGREGALLYDRLKDRLYHIPIYPVETVDPTGAGDAFCGGYLAGLLATGEPFRAACYGAVSASYVVQHVGALRMLELDFADRDQRLAHVLATAQRQNTSGAALQTDNLR